MQACRYDRVQHAFAARWLFLLLMLLIFPSFVCWEGLLGKCDFVKKFENKVHKLGDPIIGGVLSLLRPIRSANNFQRPPDMEAESFT